MWIANQHLSPLVRPADVAVYVSSDTQGDLQDLEVHLAVQETETLHAIVVVGPWCRDKSRLRCVAALASGFCGDFGHGGLQPEGRVANMHGCDCFVPGPWY